MCEGSGDEAGNTPCGCADKSLLGADARTRVWKFSGAQLEKKARGHAQAWSPTQKLAKPGHGLDTREKRDDTHDTTDSIGYVTPLGTRCGSLTLETAIGVMYDCK